MIDLLYSRYGAGAKDILLTEFEIGMEIIRTAQKEKNEELFFYRWAVAYQRIMSFEEFKQQLGMGQKDSRQTRKQTADEILSEVRGILDGNF